MGSDLSTETAAADAALVARAQAGDRQAFSALVRRHQSLVFRVCCRILSDPRDAEDAAQEALFRAYQKLDGFRGQSAFKTWLLRVAVNVCLNERNRHRRAAPLAAIEADTLADLNPGPEAAHLRAEAVARLHDALRLLPPNHRAAVVLRDLEGLTYSEVAAAMGVPEGSAKGWAHRGRARLKDLLT